MSLFVVLGCSGGGDFEENFSVNNNVDMGSLLLIVRMAEGELLFWK